MAMPKSIMNCIKHVKLYWHQYAKIKALNINRNISMAFIGSHFGRIFTFISQIHYIIR